VSISKPVIAPATKPALAAAPEIGDLSRKELLECLDVANSNGDREMVATLYRELQRRRAN
jgi:hypothetical protein